MKRFFSFFFFFFLFLFLLFSSLPPSLPPSPPLFLMMGGDRFSPCSPHLAETFCADQVGLDFYKQLAACLCCATIKDVCYPAQQTSSFAQAIWPACFLDPSVSTPHSGFRYIWLLPGFFVGVGDLNIGSHVCASDALTHCLPILLTEFLKRGVCVCVCVCVCV